MRSLRKRSWLAQFLLPAILFRALIPVGFMPVADADGRLNVIFCAVSGDSAHGAAQAHHHGQHDGTGGAAGSSHSQSICPFTASTGLAPLPEFSAPVPALADFVTPAGRDSTRQFIPTIIRAQSPRAPPGVA